MILLIPSLCGLSKKFNEAIIYLVGQNNIEKIDSMNPLKISAQLSTYFSKITFANKNIIIAPLGTKPQTVGLYLYLKNRPQNKIICYAAPRIRNEIENSIGVGESWVLRTDDEIL